MTDSGRLPRMGFEPRQPRTGPEPADEFAARMSVEAEEAKAALTKAKEEYAQYYNRRRTPAPEYKPGDRVWLDSSNIKTTRPSAKLAHRCLGPYVIDREVGNGAYNLKLPPSLRALHDVFPVVKRTPAPPDPIPGRRPAPPPTPVLVEGVEEYVVEEILNSRFRYGRIEYLVKWKGFDDGANSWEPHYNVHSPPWSNASTTTTLLPHDTSRQPPSPPCLSVLASPLWPTVLQTGDLRTEALRLKRGVM